MGAEMKLVLRPYQNEAVQAVYKYLANHDDNPCVVIPTAGGKSLCIAQIATDAVQKWHGRVLVLAHVKELLEQNAGKIKALCEGIDVGVYSAGLNSRDTDTPILVAGIQSIYNKADVVGKFDLIIVDEAHLIVTGADGEGMYRTFISAMQKKNPLLRVIGFTATPYRMKGGLICKPENILNKVCFEVGIKEMIAQGYLSPLISYAGKAEADLSSLHIRGGEFIADEVEKAMDEERLVVSACREIYEKTMDRKSVLIFTSSVKHCRHVVKILSEMAHQEVAIVTGDTPPDERAEILDRFKGVEIKDLLGDAKPPLKFLCNVNVLTTGFDAPNVDCIALLRPTNSPGLLVQTVGRGFRLSPQTGKKNCLAEGTLILTNVGLVPIENVTKDMLLWDGVEYVHHDGVIYKGEQNVISYAGITATPDHKVYYQHNWRTLEASAKGNLPVAVTGDGRKAIREADGYFRRGGCSCGKIYKAKKNFGFNAMSVWRNCLEKHRQCEKINSGVSCLRQAENRSPMACATGDCGKGTMRKSERSKIQGLRRAWHKILLQWADGNGSLFNGAFRLLKSKDANRPDQQQRELCSGKYSHDHTEYQRDEYAASKQNQDAAIQDETSRNTIRGCNFMQSVSSWIFGRRNHQALLQEVEQTKRRVWDILNSGPRHRFTANGLLVSNCLVLDYGENIMRHGPIDCIRIHEREKGNGKAPAKMCPECRALVHASYSVCPECGFVFPVDNRNIKISPYASHDGILSGQISYEEYDVLDVSYEIHHKRGDHTAPPTLQVNYRVGMYQFKHEWVCPEHSGYARQKFEKWWYMRAAIGVLAPATVEEAIAMARDGLLAEPKKIRVQIVSGEKYERIVKVELGERPRFTPVEADEEIPF